MTILQKDLAKFAKEQIPLGFAMPLLHIFPGIYAETHRWAYANFPAPEARDLLPHLRRAVVEKTVAQVAADCPGVQQSAQLNAGRNCRHREVRAGCILLTTSYTEAPARMVRDAQFRLTLAESNQPYLFEELDKRLRGNAVYALILHGPHVIEPSTLGFLRLAFPAPDLNGYLENVDMFSLFQPEIGLRVPVEYTDFEPQIGLLRDSIRMEEQE